MTKLTLKVYRDRSRKWRWKLIGGNNEKVGASSEGFERKAGVLKNLRLVTGITDVEAPSENKVPE